MAGIGSVGVANYAPVTSGVGFPVSGVTGTNGRRLGDTGVVNNCWDTSSLFSVPDSAGFLPDLTRPILNYQTSVGDTAADEQSEPVGLMISATGDGRGVVNLGLSSQDFRSSANGNPTAYWLNTNMSVALASGTAPDGTNTMNAVTCNSNGAAINASSMTIAVGQTVTRTVYAKKSVGDFFRVVITGAGSECNCWFNINTGATGNNDAGSGNIAFSAKSIESIGNGVYRLRLTVTTAVITSVNVLYYNCTSNSASSVAGNIALLWGDMPEIGSTPSAYQANTATLGGPSMNWQQATAPARPTFASIPRGGVVNAIRNNTMVGGSAPSTAPTNWVLSVSPSGLTTTLVFGVDSGIDYMDLAVSGTPSGAGAYDILFEQTGVIPAANSQQWIASSYLLLTGGTLTGVSSSSLCMSQRDSGGTNVGRLDGVTFTISSSGALSTNRPTGLFTTNSASVAFVFPFLRLDLSGAAVNFTIRIGLPQLQRGSVATSPQRRNNTAFLVTESGAPQVPILYFDGGDHMTINATSYDGINLFCDASSRWSVGFVFSSFTNFGDLISSASNFAIVTSGGNNTYVSCRGANTGLGVNGIDGVMRCVICTWDGSVLRAYMGSNTPTSCTVGGSAITSNNIEMGRLTGGGAELVGYAQNILSVNRTITAGEVAQLRSAMQSQYGAV